MIDFVTIIFNDEIEINLLKLQAYSFYLVDINIINKIYVLFNDNICYMDAFKKLFFSEIIKCYPNYLHEKIVLMNSEEIGLPFERSSWFTQQIAKIQFSKYIKAKYYVVLDGKNHFKEKITYNDFFYNEKPILYFNSHGDKMLEFYNNCLTYFDVECPRKEYVNKRLKIQTITPFIFITEICSNLIDYVKNRENTSFVQFINNKKTYTEFFFYYAYLIHLNLCDLYHFSEKQNVIIIGALDPKIYLYNSWDSKKDNITS